MPLGEPGPVTPLFAIPPFFLQAPVDWFGLVPLTGLSWLPSKLNCSAFQIYFAPFPHLSIATGHICFCTWLM